MALLVPDFEESSYLPSFVNIRKKTLDLLYQGGGLDKSPKGSVDELIQPLVDLLNQHPSFSTLSSCSGRIALFDPGQTLQHEPAAAANEEHDVQAQHAMDDERSKSSGKGRGTWLLSSHDILNDNVLIQLLDSSSSSSTMVFKHEPLLLHVAACNVERGRQLLTLALGLGFRESGLVVTETRVTVAIRGLSLGMTVPLAREGPLRPSDQYLIAVMQQANERMRINQDKLKQLHQQVAESLFQRGDNTYQSQQEEANKIQVSIEKLPPLNLWGLAAVTIPTTDDVYVFGGYGCGPFTFGQRCKRSNQVLRLSKENGFFKKEWTEMEQIRLNEVDAKENLETTSYGIDVILTNFVACEGLQAIILPLNEEKKSVVAIWGGRAGPTRPFGDLLLYEPESRTDCFAAPVDIKGDLPEPRWGHTFTALSGQHGHLAVIVGGRTEHECLASVFLLSLVGITGGKRNLKWTKLEVSIPPLFHHTVISTKNDSLIIFGGLSDQNNLLESFSDSFQLSGLYGRDGTTPSPQATSSFHAFKIQSDGSSQLIELKASIDTIPSYAGSGFVLGVDGKTIIGLLGGMPSHSSRALIVYNPLLWFSVETIDGGFVLSPLDLEYVDGMNEINVAALVHNCCIGITGSKEEACSLGGGVSSFAFGELYAE